MSKYEKFEALYTIEGLNKYIAQGWELVGDPTSCTNPDTDRPATCWTVGKPKARPEIPKMDLAGANRGLS